MSHHLTQPEEIDQVWMAHAPEEDTSQSEGRDVSFEAEGEAAPGVRLVVASKN